MVVKNIQFTRIEIKIVKYIFKHYLDRYNPRQLARILNINHAHANKLCNLLTKKQLLIKEEIGNSKFFSYNYKNDLSIGFIEYILNFEDFPEWLIVILHKLKEFKPYIKMGFIFGSSIKNKDFNDIDVFLLYDKKFFNEVKQIKDKIRKSGLVDKPIRYMELTEGDIFSNNHSKVFYSILADNLVFYNPKKYVELIRRCHMLKIT